MRFNEENSVENYVINELSGVNLNNPSLSDGTSSQWEYIDASTIDRNTTDIFIISELKEALCRLNPAIEDNFIDSDLTISEYIDEIIKSFQQTSTKNFIVNYNQNSNPFNITKSIEIVYGLRNFIGNANKFSANKIFIDIKSDSDLTEVIIEDDGEGYPKDVLSKIGEPYIKSVKSSIKSKSGLGLGIFIGKTLLEKNYANILCRNSKTRGGAEVSIKWKNEDLLKL